MASRTWHLAGEMKFSAMNRTIYKIETIQNLVMLHARSSLSILNDIGLQVGIIGRVFFTVALSYITPNQANCILKFAHVRLIEN